MLKVASLCLSPPRSVKYLYKYIFKGHDRAEVQLHAMHEPAAGAGAAGSVVVAFADVVQVALICDF